MFTLTIETENEAFTRNPAGEVARILEAVVYRLRKGETEGKTMDTNGNSVGRFTLEG